MKSFRPAELHVETLVLKRMRGLGERVAQFTNVGTQEIWIVGGSKSGGQYLFPHCLIFFFSSETFISKVSQSSKTYSSIL
jgi:hypothetical protein